MATAAAATAVLCVLPFSASAADAIPKALSDAVNYPGRPFADEDRDALRKPAEVIAFSGIKPGMKVADFMPGDGYYTLILSHLVGPNGHVYAFVPHGGANPQYVRDQIAESIRKGIAPPPRPVDSLLAIENIREYNNVTTVWEALTQYKGQFGVPEQLDAVWTSDNYHDLHTAALETPDVGAVDRAIFRALKNGGVYFIVDHAAAKGTGFSQVETLHRVDADAVKKEVSAAGFVLDGESNVLANPKDDRSKASVDPGMHDKTDQFVLRFKKPMNAPNTDKRPPASWMDHYYGNTYVYDLGAVAERRHYYHTDGTYQEFGNTGTRLQVGWFFWDADGHNCQMHQYPLDERGFVVCHAFMPLKVGDVAMQDNGGTAGSAGVGPRKVTILPGYQGRIPVRTKPE
jgi:predicted methyltransferase